MNQLKIVNTLILILSICMASYGQNGIDHFNEGLDLMEKGNYQEAIETFSKGIELDDIAKSVNYFGRAYSYFEMNDFENAKIDIEKSLLTEQINNENINCNIYWLKGMVASAEGEKKLEIESYEKAITYNPEKQNLNTTLGLAYIKDDQLEKGIEILDKVIIENNQDAYAFNNRALGFIKAGELEKAKSDLDKSKELDQENPFLYMNYFWYYKEKGEKTKACDAIEEALRREMSNYGKDEDTEEFNKIKNEFCS